MEKQAFNLMMARFDGIENSLCEIKECMGLHQEMLEDHEKKFQRQAGMMIGGGAVVTLLAGVASWLTDLLWRS